VINEPPITPPPELVGQWQDESPETQITDHIQYLTTRAAQWGADQELEACCEWLRTESKTALWQTEALRAARRPQPPSPKLQALKAISHLLDGAGRSADNANAAATIRRALEALDD
jgi:hypothetical protein